MFSLLPHLCCRKGDEEVHFFMSLTIFSHLPHFCCWQWGSRVSWLMPLSILFQSFTTNVLWAGGFRRLKFFATFNNVSVIYHTCAIGRGFQEAHGFCHFQCCFIHLPHMCYRQGGSGGSYFLPLSKMFQSFTNPLL